VDLYYEGLKKDNLSFKFQLLIKLSKRCPHSYKKNKFNFKIIKHRLRKVNNQLVIYLGKDIGSKFFDVLLLRI
jgi:hypothetical protein